jgi:hypothetical protein
MIKQIEDLSPGGRLQLSDLTALEFDLEIGAEYVQLILRLVIYGALW